MAKLQRAVATEQQRPPAEAKAAVTAVAQEVGCQLQGAAAAHLRLLAERHAAALAYASGGGGGDGGDGTDGTEGTEEQGAEAEAEAAGAAEGDSSMIEPQSTEEGLDGWASETQAEWRAWAVAVVRVHSNNSALLPPCAVCTASQVPDHRQPRPWVHAERHRTDKTR
jgi:hypothetical protein